EAGAVKNDAGYGNWTQLKVINNLTPQVPTSTQQVTKSTYETPEERAERRALDKEKFAFEKEKQKLIIRQSSLANAVNLLKGSGDETVEQIIEFAKEFEAYVIGD